jgi:sterol desaturase/sphingolipid hydroxylase (fatty acid hydroxylase superfamily)
MDFLIDAFEWLQQTLFESVLQPIVFGVGQGNLLEKAYEGAGWLVVGLLQIAVMLTVIGPMQKLLPAEQQPDRQVVRVDVLYTLIHRLGLFKLGMFFSLDYALEQGWGVLRSQGWPTFHLDGLWPGITDLAWVSFVLYLVVFDLVNYAIHRAQHQSSAWWALHSMHHAQRQMSMWSDNRNHLLDDMLTSLVVSAVALLIGVGPGQFVALVAIGQLSENFQHANVRIWFGRIGERLWVSPRFHRRHHSIGIGHEFEVQGRKVLGGCNFGVLFPWWDMLFGTADFVQLYEATGVRDQVEQGRDYGQGFWAQQRQGLLRLVGKA